MVSLKCVGEKTIFYNPWKMNRQDTRSRKKITKKKKKKVIIPNNFFHDLMRDFAKDVTSSSVLCLRIAFTDIPILVDCNKENYTLHSTKWKQFKMAIKW